ncbi:hypothetical protein [Confluentibacter flavum]|uniref:DUF4468 domain-containing protein n=1 Tax=Confluentibacter flavum TaxID=1909700 RepID=A0A2N3HPK8_9FLAO|nr:hypothetical protein [Confluentibacter flavum]PKQ46885.1 hypothetical protein CSW08_00815 [Confluentibacter flavum]
MKTIIIVFINLASSFCFSQDHFIYNENGITENVVVIFDNLSKDFIFKKTQEWYKKNREPGKFTINTVNRKKSFIRMKGWKFNYTFAEYENFTEYYDAEYVIEIYINEGNYKLFPKKLKLCPYEEIYDEDKSTLEELFFCDHIDIKVGETVYNAKFGGATKLQKLIEDLFNTLNKDLENFIKEEAKKTQL